MEVATTTVKTQMEITRVPAVMATYSTVMGTLVKVCKFVITITTKSDTNWELCINTEQNINDFIIYLVYAPIVFPIEQHDKYFPIFHSPYFIAPRAYAA